MSAEFAFILCFIATVTILVTGIVFVHSGMKEDENGNRNPTFIKIGWIIIGALSLVVTGGIVFLAIETSFMVGFLFLILPLLVLIGLAITLSYGIFSLIVGYHKDKEGNIDIARVKVGWINIGVNIAIITAILVLLLMFMTGIIPIRLM